MDQLNQLMQALQAQRAQMVQNEAALAGLEDDRLRANTRSFRGLIPGLIETAVDAHKRKKLEPQYTAALEQAMNSAAGYDDIAAQYQQMLAAQKAQEEEARKAQLAQGAGYSPGQAAAVAAGVTLPVQQKPDKPPTVVAALQAAGIPPDSPEGRKLIQQYLSKGNQTTQITIPTGYAPVDPANPTAGFRPIPGSPQAMEVEQRTSAEADAGLKRAGSAQNVLDAIDRLKANTGPTTAGWGGLLANVPSSAAKTYKNDLNTVMANLAFDRLQEMRDASKTGGALGQVSNIELDLLKSTVAGLEQTQAPDDLKERLDIVAGQYKRFTDAISGSVPEGYETKEIPGRGKFIKIDGQWYPL